MSTFVLLTALALSACGDDEPDGPTVAEAERALRSQVDAALDGASPRGHKVTDAGGKDVPCGERRARRAYAVSAQTGTSPALTPVEIKNGMVGALPGFDAFDIVEDNRATHAGEPSRIKLENKASRTSLVISVPTKRQVTVSGTTDCLRTG
ncbi:hypothetical protein GCM10010411_51480 [Actinomadura fulvescens]|uniref:Lipoprotein n=1 Tax=Actinomadura fulvescens TaxID=46160 RepID=A0ABN3Q0G9_9ACTN